MLQITLADGSICQYSSGITPLEIAKNLSETLARNALSASLDGKQVELSTPILENAKLKIYTWEDELGKKAFWHSSAHLLAQAILEFFPQAKLTIGPPISEGFYYDVDFGELALSKKDFEQIEKKMLENAKKKSTFKLYPIAKYQALNHFKDNSYKLELITNLEDGQITFCSHDDFTDLCRGGHLVDTSAIKAIKLLSIAGAYWRGNEKNTQLTRIRGISFPKQKLLEEYLYNLEEAKKRDHRKLGKELKLFTFSSKVGSGLPLWLSKGTILRKNLEDFLLKAQKERGYEMVISPHIGHKELYKTSGHWEKYGEDSFRPIQTPQPGEEFLLKPMNCPHHCEIYKAEPYSYKDLPKRFAEFGTVYRYEQSGELHGLSRTRGFTQDDAHIFCRPDQLLEEFKQVIDLTLYVFGSLGFKDYKAQISLRDPKTPEKYIGSDENWQKAEQAILEAAKQKDLKTTTAYGEAAFYGPKLDFMIEDALKRSWQLGTIQVDYNLPERFDLHYKGSDNQLHRPIMIHRAPFGSLERFIAILIEHTGGNFPFWLAPIQISILPIGEKHIKYAKKVLNLLSSQNLRAFVDDRAEKIAKKVRESELDKIPFMLILGDKEESSEEVTLRKHGSLESKPYSTKECLNFFIKEKEIKL